MKNDVLLYLTEASFYLLVFALIYKLLLARLTHFRWMRVYLIASVFFSILVPLLSVPISWTAWLVNQESEWQPTSLLFTSAERLSSANASSSPATNPTGNGFFFFTWMIVGIYALGVLYKTYILGRNLWNIHRLIADHPKQRDGRYWMVSLPPGGTAFAFLHYIFLSTPSSSLTNAELQQVKDHERAHGQQGHTFDRLLFEFADCLFWFNPLMRYLKNQLHEVHEYLADYVVGGTAGKRKAYAHLLLKLATETQSVPLATSFSGKQIGRRILMLSQPRSSPRKKFFFVGMVPVMASLSLLSACLEERSGIPEIVRQENVKDNQDQRNALVVGQVIWKGNNLYSDEMLNSTFGLHPGDPYDSLDLHRRLFRSFHEVYPDYPDLVSLYMNRGYIDFSVKVKTHQTEAGIIDLTIDIYEGPVMKIARVLIRGNQDVPEEKILAQIPIKRGQLFNRSHLVG